MRQATESDSTKFMHFCHGNCIRVPDDICDAVLDTLTYIPGGDRSLEAKDTRAILLISRMAAEGWRFCPCYSKGNTQQHARIFALVQTDLANNLADRAGQESASYAQKRSAA